MLAWPARMPELLRNTKQSDTIPAGRPPALLPSDVMQMQQALFLPYWFWGFACGAFAVAVLLYGVRTCWSRRA